MWYEIDTNKDGELSKDEIMALVQRLGSGAWAAASPDASTFEYVGLLCAQALRLDEATAFATRALGVCRTSSGQ